MYGYLGEAVLTPQPGPPLNFLFPRTYFSPAQSTHYHLSRCLYLCVGLLITHLSSDTVSSMKAGATFILFNNVLPNAYHSAWHIVDAQ